MRKFLIAASVLGGVLFVAGAAYTEAVEAEMQPIPALHVVSVEPSVVVPAEPAPEPVAPVVRRVDRASRLEAEWFSRISVSEGGHSELEAQALLQALEDMRKGRPLLDTMYAQSPHVTKRKPYTDTRQVWVSNLPMKGEEMPEGWVECTGRDPVTKKKTPAGCAGTWAATVKGWKVFRAYAHQLYWSGVVPNVIHGEVVQWGGDMDYWRGVGRNFCPLSSPGTKNTFWGLPEVNGDRCLPIDQDKVQRSKVLMATIAAGRKARQHLLPQAPMVVD